MGNRLGQNVLALPSQRPILGFKDHRHAVGSPFGQLAAGGFRKKLVRNLKQNSRTVAGGFVASGGTAMMQIQQNLFAMLKDGVFAPSGNVHYRSDAAGIVLKSWIVKTLGLGGSICHILFAFSLIPAKAPGTNAMYLLTHNHRISERSIQSLSAGTPVYFLSINQITT
jgi:choline dehydrogenase-like flavoprotein